MFRWQLDLSDNDIHRAWICEMPDGSELFVEQFYSMQTSIPVWKSSVKMGKNGEYQCIWLDKSASFKTRIKAQETAELFYTANREKLYE